MNKNFKNITKNLYDASFDLVEHDGIEHAGYLAFLSILTFFPFLVFLIAFAGFIGEFEIGYHFVTIVLEQLPEKVVFAIKPRLEEIIAGPPESFLTIAVVGALWTASSSVEGLRTILNRAFRVNSAPPYIWRRLLSIIQFLFVTLIIILVTALTIFMPIAVQKISFLQDIFANVHPVWNYVRIIVTYAGIFMCICFCYKIIPNNSNTITQMMPGALITLIGWLISVYLLGIYVSSFNQINLIYGSLGGVVAALLFSYVISIVFIYGAEFNYHFMKNRK
jgi:membrane protein